MGIKYLKNLFRLFFKILKKNGIKETCKRTIIFFIKRLPFYKNIVYNKNYSRWVEYFDTIRDSDILEMRQQTKNFEFLPLISIVTSKNAYIFDFLKKQTYTKWELCKSFKETKGEYVAFLNQDVILPPHALWTVVHYINKSNTKVDLLYPDEDELDKKFKRKNPYFKGNWNQQMLIQQNYVSHFAVYRRSTLDKIQGIQTFFDNHMNQNLLLTFITLTDISRIVHIPYILCHCKKNDHEKKLQDREPVPLFNNENIYFTDLSKQGKPWRDWLEFVCPFHRGDVLLGLQVACTAATMGKKIRMHVSKDIYGWLESFPYKRYIQIEPIDIEIPKAETTGDFLQQALRKVALREDSSGLIACSHPKINLKDMGIDLVENMLRNIGLPITTKLINVVPEINGSDVSSLIPESIELGKCVLLHPNGGWELKSMSPKIIEQIANVVHRKDYKLIQIGGKTDKKTEFADAYILENISLSEWTILFKTAKAIISVDSWTSHFGSIVNANQVIVYGPTKSRDVESKRHFKNQEGAYLKFDSLCTNSPCDAFYCPKNGTRECNKMIIDEIKLVDFLSHVI